MMLQIIRYNDYIRLYVMYDYKLALTDSLINKNIFSFFLMHSIQQVFVFFYCRHIKYGCEQSYRIHLREKYIWR